MLRLWALCFGSSRRRSRHTCPGPCEARRSSLLSCSGQGCTHGNDRCGPPTIAVLGLDACFGSPRRRSGHTRVSPMRTRRSSLSCSDCGRCVLVRHDVAVGTHALAPAKPAGAVYCPAQDKGACMARSGAVRQPSPCSDWLDVSVRNDVAVGTRAPTPASPPEQLVLLRLCALCFGSSRARSRHTCPGPCEARRSSLLSCSGQGRTHGNGLCSQPSIAVFGLAACSGSSRRCSGHARIAPPPCEPAGARYCPTQDEGGTQTEALKAEEPW